VGLKVRILIGLLALTGAAAARAAGESVQQLGSLSLAELTQVEVTSVSKRAQPLNSSPAAIYVITEEEIHRSGLHTLPEILRLAPNLQVHQLSTSNYQVTARGLVGNPGDQAFSNKLLILIDGRSVYSPLFSGVFFDQLDVMSEDIERIEVISGPGATLWGANAVNGVINIITRDAHASGGGLLRLEGGDRTDSAAARYGGGAGDALAYRVYAAGFRRAPLELADGSSAHDRFEHGQAGFRSDWQTVHDSLTVQGDAFRGTEEQPAALEVPTTGANLLGRWQHYSPFSVWQLQTYIDHQQVGQPLGGAGFVLTTYDLELQQNLMIGSRARLVWGAGERLSDYHIDTTPSYYYVPPHRWLRLTNLFAQGSFSLRPQVELTAGLKLEDDPYAGWSAMPDLRLAWTLDTRNFLWAAVSRAVRSPTPFDTDVREAFGGMLALTGKPNFATEKLWAYEAGYRVHPSEWLNLSLSAYYNVYDDLRTIEPASSQALFPIHWDNLIAGHTYGILAWADLEVAPWWRLSPSVRTYHAQLHFRPGASGILGVAQAGDDPGSMASLKSSMNLGTHLTFDAYLRHVANLPDPYAPAYTELGARLAWVLSREAELALQGSNLLHARHQEFALPYGELIRRGVSLEARLSF
jgi:iron complex outermembrane recepter protein